MYFNRIVYFIISFGFEYYIRVLNILNFSRKLFFYYFEMIFIIEK